MMSQPPKPVPTSPAEPPVTERRAEPRIRERSDADRALAAAFLNQLRAGGDTRTRKVRRIRAAIRCTAYENDLKAAIAIDRLAKDLEG